MENVVRKKLLIVVLGLLFAAGMMAVLLYSAGS